MGRARMSDRWSDVTAADVGERIVDLATGLACFVHDGGIAPPRSVGGTR